MTRSFFKQCITILVYVLLCMPLQAARTPEELVTVIINPSMQYNIDLFINGIQSDEEANLKKAVHLVFKNVLKWFLESGKFSPSTIPDQALISNYKYHKMRVETMLKLFEKLAKMSETAKTLTEKDKLIHKKLFLYQISTQFLSSEFEKIFNELIKIPIALPAQDPKKRLLVEFIDFILEFGRNRAYKSLAHCLIKMNSGALESILSSIYNEYLSQQIEERVTFQLEHLLEAIAFYYPQELKNILSILIKLKAEKVIDQCLIKTKLAIFEQSVRSLKAELREQIPKKLPLVPKQNPNPQPNIPHSEARNDRSSTAKLIGLSGAGLLGVVIAKIAWDKYQQRKKLAAQKRIQQIIDEARAKEIFATLPTGPVEASQP